MNRDILFRAKLKDDYSNKGWQYGLVYCTWFSGNIFKYWLKPIKKKNLTTFDTVCVDPETICEYTGLTDKNGTKIFEGDIVRYGDSIHKVVFEQRNGTAYFGLFWSPKETVPFGKYQDLRHIEVIGNIYDNPELLKA